MLSYFLQMLYGMADLYMMGQFSGAAGITAVGNGAQTLYIITVTLVGLAMGTTVIVGHAVGSRRFDRAETAIGNTITLFMGVSVVLAAALLALCPQIVALIGTPAEAVEGTAAYLRICFIGIPFIAAYNILSAIFRGLGDSRSPMYVIGVACIINIALDFLFIGHMGARPRRRGTRHSHRADGERGSRARVAQEPPYAHSPQAQRPTPPARGARQHP